MPKRKAKPKTDGPRSAGRRTGGKIVPGGVGASRPKSKPKKKRR